MCLQGIDIYEITDELTDDSWTYDIGNFNPYRSEVTQLTVSINSQTNQFSFLFFFFSSPGQRPSELCHHLASVRLSYVVNFHI